MATDRDPIQKHTDGSADLYDIATWDVRSHLDRLAVSIYTALRATSRLVVFLLALLILLIQLVLGGLGAAFADPAFVVFVGLSIVPALLLAVYVWYVDITTSEPLTLVVGTFVLGVLFAGFAGVLNTLAQPLFQYIPLIGTVLFFYLFVAPVEETVKLLAIRLYAYRRPRFDAVIDGAVYGAVAGLGFATIENVIYIASHVTNPLVTNLFIAAGGIVPLRALAGPGHVIYSTIAGYYLGLAKFNPESAGPIVVKGVLIAAAIHATYNTLVAIVPGLLGRFIAVPPFVGFFAFVIVYDGIIGLYLYRKLARYHRTYDTVGAGSPD
jgi:RsiW-degrading membrane proteinase PrsW (M82 family)